MKLSILIPSTFDRREITESLVSKLESICDGQPSWFFLYGESEVGEEYDHPVEIVVEYDNREMSIGAKRQKMLEEARGDYVVYIDSDDWISDDYVSNILSAIAQNPDSIGFDIECSGTKGKTASVSTQWDRWAENVGGYDYVRCPYQKSPIRREIALQIGYKDMRYGEDFDYSTRLKKSGLIQTEVYINEVMYYYRYAYQDPRLKYGVERKASNTKRKHR